MRSGAKRASTTLLSEGQAGSGSRQRLSDAMVSVVARRGYQQSTVKDVISRAGSSRSTFYAQFADMEDCLGAVLAVLADELYQEVHGAVNSAPPADAPRAAARALLDFAHEREAPARVLFCVAAHDTLTSDTYFDTPLTIVCQVTRTLTLEPSGARKHWASSTRRTRSSPSSVG
jgi:AcrR family transcriptional regulator